jgi:hypothetical protein
MRQIKHKPFTDSSPDSVGERDINDVQIFYPSGRMSKVWLMWETVRRFADLLDDVHAKEILSLESILKKYKATEPVSEDELDDLCIASDLHSRTTLSSKVLINAAVLELISGFVEFAVKEIVKLVEPTEPVPGRRWSDLISILKAKGIFKGYPESYRQHVQAHRETVRNTFAHGDWEQLSAEVGAVDLDDVLFATVEFIWSMQGQLHEQGYDLQTPTIEIINPDGETPESTH